MHTRTRLTYTHTNYTYAHSLGARLGDATNMRCLTALLRLLVAHTLPADTVNPHPTYDMPAMAFHDATGNKQARPSLPHAP